MFLLQTRDGQRTPKATLKIAMDLHAEGVIDTKTVMKRVTAKTLDLIKQPSLSLDFDIEPIFKGIPACSGIVTGKPVFTSKDAIDCTEPCILITKETNPEDIAGMHAAVGVLTMEGGSTSHAAVVARGMNKPCVVGLGKDASAFAGFAKVSICGATGRVWGMEVPLVDASQDPVLEEFKTLLHNRIKYVPVIKTVPTQHLECAVVEGTTTRLTMVKEMAEKVDLLFIDIRRNAFETAFFDIFGADEQEVASALDDHLPDSANVVLVVTTGVKSKFRVLGNSDNLESLIMASGFITKPTKGLSPAALKVIEWQKLAGLQIVSVGEYDPDTTSLMSDEQAHQLLSS